MTATDDAAEARDLLLRYVREAGGAADRDLAITRYEGQFAPGDPPTDEVLHARAAAGVLRTMRALPVPLRPDPTGEGMLAFASLLTDEGLSTAAIADIEQALAHFTYVVDHAPAGSPLRQHVLGQVAMLRLVLARGGLDDLGPALALLRDAVAGLPASPVRNLATVLSAMLGDSSADPDQARVLPDGIGQLFDHLPPGHALRPMLASDLATRVSETAGATGALDGLADARRLVEAAVAELPPDDPSRDELARKLAGLMVSSPAYAADLDDVDPTVALAEDLLAAAIAAGDQVVVGKDHFLHAMALLLRAHRDGTAADQRAAVEDLQLALAKIPVDDPLRPTVMGVLGALLHDRHLGGGVREDTDAAALQLDRALTLARTQVTGSADFATRSLEGLGALNRAMAALSARDLPAVDASVVELRATLERLTDTYWRPRIAGVLGTALLVRGLSRGGPADLREGLDVMEAAAAGPVIESDRSTMTVLAAGAELVRGVLDDSDDAIRTALGRLAGVNAAGTAGHLQRVWFLAMEGTAWRLEYERTADPQALEVGIACLEKARALLPGDIAAPLGQLLPSLADAYWRRAGALSPGVDRAGQQAIAVRTGLAGLRARGAETLIQTSPAHSLLVARDVAVDAERVARWALAADLPELAVHAVEMGRGLLLHATTSSARVGSLLQAAGHDALAAEWEAAAAAAPPPWATGSPPPTAELAGVASAPASGEAPTDLRRRVLEALSGVPEAIRLLALPELPDIAAGIREVGADALVYLIAGDHERSGIILVVRADGTVQPVCCPELRHTPDGPLGRYLVAATAHAAQEPAAGRTTRDLRPEQARTDVLGALCDWAWVAAVEPLSRHVHGGARGFTRLVLIPGGVLGQVPWHAARRRTAGGYRYAVADFELSYAASARQLLDVLGRRPCPVPADPVLVADPTGDLPGARVEIRSLHEQLYPKAVVLGTGSGQRGTPQEVLAHLPGADSSGASLLHLACHAAAAPSPERSHLRLVDTAGVPAHLLVSTILARAERRQVDTVGGLVVLSACTTGAAAGVYDEGLSLATAFLAAGSTAVVGSLWPVPDAATPHLMFMFHHCLTVAGLPPAAALRAAQLWMLDPHRTHPPGAPRRPAAPEHPDELASLVTWAAFVHHGR